MSLKKTKPSQEKARTRRLISSYFKLNNKNEMWVVWKFTMSLIYQVHTRSALPASNIVVNVLVWGTLEFCWFPSNMAWDRKELHQHCLTLLKLSGDLIPYLELKKYGKVGLLASYSRLS